MRRHNYVVGYKSEGNCIYGKDDGPCSCRYINLMTLFQAKKELKNMITRNGPRVYKGVVYKLVEVK